MRKILIYVVIVLVIMMACQKEKDEASSKTIVYEKSSAATQLKATISYPFTMQATGSFTISPVSPTVVAINQQMLFTSSSPFTLIEGIVTGFDDLTIPTFPERFFNGSFKFYGQGNDSLFAAVTVQTSVFSDPINPEEGDFFGSEDFTGTYIITGGTGRYIGATGHGTYNAHSEWRPPIVAGTIFSGFTTVSSNDGTITVRARNGSLQSAGNQ